MQAYGPKILKDSDAKARALREAGRSPLVAPNSEKVLATVKEVVRALVDHATHGAFKN